MSSITVPPALPALHAPTAAEIAAYRTALLELQTGWVSYASSFTMRPATVGNSTVIAQYRRIGNDVDVNISVTVGSTFVAGSGIYSFSLPFAPDTSVTPYPLVSAYVLDSGTVERGPFMGKFSGSTIILASGGTFVSNSAPQTPTTGDIYAVQSHYKAVAA